MMHNVEDVELYEYLLNMSEEEFQLHKRYNVVVTQINNPHDFYVRLVDFEAVITSQRRGLPIMKSELQEKIIVVYKSYKVNKGSGDRKFIRGRIIKNDKTDKPIIDSIKFVDLHAIDYGHIDESINVNKIYHPLPPYIKAPLAKHCRLAYCEPKGGATFSSEAISTFEVFIGEDSHFSMEVVEIKDHQLVVILKNVHFADDVATILKKTDYVDGPKTMDYTVIPAYNKTFSGTSHTYPEEYGPVASGYKYGPVGSGSKYGPVGSGSKYGPVGSGSKYGPVGSGSKYGAVTSGSKYQPVSSGHKIQPIASGHKDEAVASGSGINQIPEIEENKLKIGDVMQICCVAQDVDNPDVFYAAEVRDFCKYNNGQNKFTEECQIQPKMTLRSVKVGMLVAYRAQSEMEYYERAIIKNVFAAELKATLYLVDRGMITKANINELRTIPNNGYRTPAIAFRCMYNNEISKDDFDQYQNKLREFVVQIEVKHLGDPNVIKLLNVFCVI